MGLHMIMMVSFSPFLFHKVTKSSSSASEKSLPSKVSESSRVYKLKDKFLCVSILHCSNSEWVSTYFWAWCSNRPSKGFSDLYFSSLPKFVCYVHISSSYYVYFFCWSLATSEVCVKAMSHTGQTVRESYERKRATWEKNEIWDSVPLSSRKVVGCWWGLCT